MNRIEKWTENISTFSKHSLMFCCDTNVKVDIWGVTLFLCWLSVDQPLQFPCSKVWNISAGVRENCCLLIGRLWCFKRGERKETERRRGHSTLTGSLQRSPYSYLWEWEGRGHSKNDFLATPILQLTQEHVINGSSLVRGNDFCWMMLHLFCSQQCQLHRRAISVKLHPRHKRTDGRTDRRLESNLVHFCLTILHLVAIILMIFLIINWTNFVYSLVDPGSPP